MGTVVITILPVPCANDDFHKSCQCPVFDCHMLSISIVTTTEAHFFHLVSALPLVSVMLTIERMRRARNCSMSLLQLSLLLRYSLKLLLKCELICRLLANLYQHSVM